MPSTVTITPPYDSEYTDSDVGAHGSVNALSAAKATGKLNVDLTLLPPLGFPARESAAAIAGVGVLLDPPGGQTLSVEVGMDLLLRRVRNASHREVDVRSTGHSLLVVIEYDGNGRLIGVPILSNSTIWNVLTTSGVSTLNFGRTDVLSGQTNLTLGHTYSAWAFSAVVLTMKKNHAGSDPNRSKADAVLDTTVSYFTATVS